MECTGTLAALPMAPDLLQRFLTTSPLYSLRIFSADASEHSASAIYDVNVKYSVFPPHHPAQIFDHLVPSWSFGSV